MARYSILFSTILTGSAIVFSTVLAAQTGSEDNCGNTPIEPSILDGASSSMEELVANSKEVTGFIAAADTYLDCREAYVKDTTNGLSKDAREEISDSIRDLTKKRNDIGDTFNAQVAAFKEANPN